MAYGPPDQYDTAGAQHGGQGSQSGGGRASGGSGTQPGGQRQYGRQGTQHGGQQPFEGGPERAGGGQPADIKLEEGLSEEMRVVLHDLIQSATACEWCAERCIDEGPGMAECVRLCRDVADLATLNAQFLSRDSVFGPSAIEVFADAAEACARECARHGHRHCQECAEQLTRAVQSTRKMLASFEASGQYGEAPTTGSAQGQQYGQSQVEQFGQSGTTQYGQSQQYGQPGGQQYGQSQQYGQQGGQQFQGDPGQQFQGDPGGQF